MECTIENKPTKLLKICPGCAMDHFTKCKSGKSISTFSPYSYIQIRNLYLIFLLIMSYNNDYRLLLKEVPSSSRILVKDNS